MAAFSPLAITGYSVLAIVTSYALLRLFYFLKLRLLSSATRAALPQPVSAGRTSALSFFSPFSFLRSRQKSTIIKSVPTRSRWSPLSSFFRRLIRPSSPLHLTGAEVLPTTMPNSPSATHSLIDLPVMSASSFIPAARNHSQRFQQTRQLSRSSSMDALPSYRPLTPVPVMVPIPVHTSPPPATPPPPSPTPLPGMTDADIPLVPITPPRHKYTPVDMTSPSGLPTPPLAGTFPAISLSPFKPINPTAIPSNIAVAARPSSPSPNLFLTSRTLSSLSLSPRSLYLQQSKRSKSLGGVTVKKISPPHFDLGEPEQDFEHTQDVADCSANAGNMRVPTLIMPMFEMRDQAKEEAMGKSTKLVPPVVGSSKFLLNFSSSSSSASDSSLSSDLLSPSPLTSNSDSIPSSAPLATPRTTSQSSYSSDIAKLSENTTLLPRPIPLVDADMTVDMDLMHGYGEGEKTAGWSFDVEEPVGVERVFVDFDMPFSAYTKPSSINVGLGGGKKVEERLIELEDASAGADVEEVRENKWEWDDALEDQSSWDLEAHTEEVVPQIDDGAALEDVGKEDAVDLPPLPPAMALDKGTSVDVEIEPVADIEYPDPDLLPLPETVNILPSILTKPMGAPVISICTQPAVLSMNDSECDTDIISPSSLERGTPVSLGQTPTPPASPPREARVASLPKTGRDSNGPGLNGSVVISPVAECSICVDVEAEEDEVSAPLALPIVDHEEETLSSPAKDEEHVSADGVDAEKEEDILRILEDKPLVNSPESIPLNLGESDGEGEYTFNFEEDAEEGRADSSDDDIEVKVEVVPPSPCVRVTGWDYGSDGEGGMVPRPDYVDEIPSALPTGKVEGCGSQSGEEKTTGDNFEKGQIHGEVIEIPSDSGSPFESGDLACPTEDVSPPIIQEKATSVPVSAPALEPTTSLPGTFPDAISSSEIKVKAEPQSAPESTVQSQPRRRIRSPLEEAIARTRSPLEVALAMQLRPGLGLGADPAWMVRFLMVMWGWVFGLVLVPTAEA